MSKSLKPFPIEALPLNVEASHREFFKNHAFTNSTPSKHVRVNSVFVFCNGLIFKKGQVLHESLSTPLFLKKYSTKFFYRKFIRSLLKLKVSIRNRGQYIIVHDEWSENYFHWLTDVVPRLYISRTLLAESKLILPENFTAPYHDHTLKKFNINNIKWINDAKTLFVKNLVLPTHVSAPGGYYNPEIT